MSEALPLRVVVDTNVATTADGCNPSVSAACVADCGKALQRLMAEGHVFVDGDLSGPDARSSIVEEYRRNLHGKGQRGPGSAFLKWLLIHEWQAVRVTRVPLTRLPGDEEGYAELPTPADGTFYDVSDRKFLAVAAGHEERPVLLQAMDVNAWLAEDGCPPQFRPLWPWLRPRREALVEALWPDLMLFGEWCAFVHSVRYDALPDWFLGFDVRDRAAGRFLDVSRRDALLDAAGLRAVPRLADGVFDLAELEALLGRSTLGTEPMEGLVVRRTEAGAAPGRAKLVRPAFVQAIDEHWSRGVPERNSLA